MTILATARVTVEGIKWEYNHVYNRYFFQVGDIRVIVKSRDSRLWSWFVYDLQFGGGKKKH